MKIKYVRLGIAMVSVMLISWKPVANDWIQESHSHYTLLYTETDRSNIKEYSEILDKGIRSVQSFFGDPYKRDFQVYIHPNRQSLDNQWQNDWSMPDFKSECWMVASGIATKVDMISPVRWSEQACEHSYSDQVKTQQLITHELFHVYHGQHNASPDFSNVVNIDWFVEGFATYASGQLDASRLAAVKDAIENETVPASIDNFWTGKLKYGLSGSLVKYIDFKYGRGKLNELLVCTGKDQILNSLKITEKNLLESWSEYSKTLEVQK